ncbi:unnamed protein product [Allacma fusca]|uniref:C2H2-type domain-containing protein n=1 Tax=Allacma fusca TaxID=39272 RepID=A0A8J2JU19_9HEXA|nr:unnamed protein product [Allacma fusca]
MRIHSSKRNWKCDKCDYAAKERDKLDRHRRIHLSSAEREILMEICPFPNCDFKSLHSARLNRHLLTHSTERPFKCDKCDYAAKMRIVLLKHQRTHLTRSEKTFKVYPNQNCQFRTVSQQNVQAQLLLHQEGNILRCCPMQDCDFQTGRASNLRRHITAHSTERKFKCDKCERAFKSEWQLKEHQHTHLNDDEREAFLKKCPMRSCNFRSFYRYNLFRHLRSHSPVELLNCDKCDYSCNYYKPFKAHVLMHLKGAEPKTSVQFSEIAERYYKREQISEELLKESEVKKEFYACKICNYQNQRNDLLALHNEDLHSVPCVVVNLLPVSI